MVTSRSVEAQPSEYKAIALIETMGTVAGGFSFLFLVFERPLEFSYYYSRNIFLTEKKVKISVPKYLYTNSREPKKPPFLCQLVRLVISCLWSKVEKSIERISVRRKLIPTYV